MPARKSSIAAISVGDYIVFVVIVVVVVFVKFVNFLLETEMKREIRDYETNIIFIIALITGISELNNR